MELLLEWQEACDSLVFSSLTQSGPVLCDPMDCSTSGFPVHHQSQSLLKLMSIKSVMASNHLILSSSSPPALNLFQHQGLLQRVTSLHQMAKVLEFQLQHQSFHEYSGLISFSIDRFHLLAVQRTLRILPQHHTSKTSVLQG